MRHRVRVCGVREPQIVAQQRLELRGDEAHLGGQLHPLFAGERQRVDRRMVLRKDDRLPEHRAVLRAAERAHVDPGLDEHRAQVDPERGDRVRDARAVDMEQQPARARRLAERAQLGDRVDGADLGRLGDRDRPGLYVVLVADPPHLALHVVGGELAVLDRDVDQLPAVEALERGALVDRQVRRGGTDDRLVRPQRRGERDDVRPGPVEREKDARVLAEQRAEGGLRAARGVVVAVAGGVAVVRRGERGQDRRVDAGVVVAGEMAVGHRPTITARWLPMLPRC